MKNTLKFYKNIYEPLFKKNYTRSSHRSAVALDRFEIYLKKNNIQIKKAIDVGCAWGKTLSYWRKRGIKCVGIDVSKRAVSFCKKRGFKCYLASATDLSIFKDKEFDLYAAGDVYEHLRIEDLGDAIEEAKRITKKYLLIRPHPCLDKRKTLHLTVWGLDKWERFFSDHNLKIIKIGEDDQATYKNVFLMKVN